MPTYLGSIGASIASAILDSPGDEVRVSNVIATVESEASRKRLVDRLEQHKAKFSVRLGTDNLDVISQADIVLLAVKPFKRDEVLGVAEIRAALRGKLLLSVMAGIRTTLLREMINGSEEDEKACQVIRAMPNMAARIRKAVTLLTYTPGTVNEDYIEATHWLLEQIGQYKFVAENRFDIAGPIVGCAGSLMALAIDGLLDAAVVEGLKRQDAEFMAVESAIGILQLISSGTHPTLLREQISSPNGASSRALLRLEKHGVRYAFSDALMTAADRMRNMSDVK